MRKLLIAPLFLLLLGACTDAEQNLETAQSSDDPFLVSEDSALAIAESAVSGGENQLKDMDDLNDSTNKEKYTNLKYK